MSKPQKFQHLNYIVQSSFHAFGFNLNLVFDRLGRWENPSEVLMGRWYVLVLGPCNDVVFVVG